MESPLLRWTMSLWNSVVLWCACVWYWRRRQMYQRGSAPMWMEWSGCSQWCLHHIDRCQDDGAPQLYKRSSDDYGLQVSCSSSSTIQLVSPLTKEQVSLDNGGGGNWGADMVVTSIKSKPLPLLKGNFS